VPTAIPAPVRLSSGVSVLWCERPDAHRKTRWNHRGGSGSPLIYLLFLLAHAAERLSRELPRPFEASTAWCRSRSARRPCVHLWQIQSPGHMANCYNLSARGVHGEFKGIRVHSFAVATTTRRFGKPIKTCRCSPVSPREVEWRAFLHKATEKAVSFGAKEDRRRTTSTLGETESFRKKKLNDRGTEASHLSSRARPDSSCGSCQMGEGEAAKESGLVSRRPEE
jgi:hypothetical protein